jgi:hypothetical protein
MIELHNMEYLKDAYDEDEAKMWDDIYAEVVEVAETGFATGKAWGESKRWKLVVQGYGTTETYTYFVPDDTLLKVIDAPNSMYWIVKEMV